MKIENRQQFLILLVLMAAGLWIGNSLIYEPLSKWWTTRSKQITELRSQVKDGKSLVARASAIQEHWDGMRTNTLPDNHAVAEQLVIKAFDGWSRDTSVEITGILPQWKNDTDDYQTLNCRVEAAGNLGALSQFLYDIEKGPLALRLDSLELNARDNGGQQFTLGLQVSGLALISSSKP